MTNDRSGLRFDIYERVHVADDLAGIKELDEIELVPHIRVNVEDDQAVLKGNLWLTGTYTGEIEGTKQTLEHLIPVEITMPLSRIDKLEDIAVEIENFDVEVLSARSLNITGVLSLRGIEMRTDDEDLTSSWTEEEEVVFVHEAAEETTFQAPGPQEAQQDSHAAEWKDIPEQVQVQGERIYPEEIGIPEFAKDGEEDPVFDQDVVEDGDEILAGALENMGDAEAVSEEDLIERLPVSTEEEKKETKLVFGSKKDDAEEPASQTKLLSSLFGQRDFRMSSDTAANHSGEGKDDVGRTERVEWKKLFLSSENDDRQSFRRLRVCIVQKEETLESIAQRYKINSREIVLYNRLSDQQVAVGQLIYIPQ